MNLKYDLDDVPPRLHLLLFGLQWLAVSIPGIVILGKIVAGLHFLNMADQVIYLQKLCFVTGLALFSQLLWGHRLPLIAGPSTVLVIGVIASAASGLDAVYGSLAAGGTLLFLVSLAGVFGRIRKLFTTRVVACLLLLIALTLTPTIIRLLTAPVEGASIPANLSFAAGVVLLMLVLYRRLTGVWKATLVVWAMAGASVAHFVLFPHSGRAVETSSAPLLSLFFHRLTATISFEPGVLVSFLFCFFALSVNDVSSIESVSAILKIKDPRKRLDRGLAVTGAANIASGVLGVVGPVNFSLSPGVIMASGCASRFALIPAAAGLVLLSFSPYVVALMGSISPVVIGAMLIYILCYQVAAGLIAAFGSEETFTLESGLALGLPLLLGTIFSFMPPDAVHAFPPILRPLAGNGFVIGTITSLAMEHLVFPRGSRSS
ncbi:MAG TPA: purine/pyrimidine permease [Syntrophorhabdaceae bacterium]|jgi:xanthine/uracil permease